MPMRTLRSCTAWKSRDQYGLPRIAGSCESETWVRPRAASRATSSATSSGRRLRTASRPASSRCDAFEPPQKPQLKWQPRPMQSQWPVRRPKSLDWKAA
jgi:hypothetical protein